MWPVTASGAIESISSPAPRTKVLAAVRDGSGSVLTARPRYLTKVGSVVLWVLFAAELGALVTLAVQRSWLMRGLAPWIVRATAAGEARQAGHPGLPLDDERLHRRIFHLVTACGLV